tara:strand:- start:387 stop:692 length:306 start_codon:yes stop_codon:yes gene_type:complete
MEYVITALLCINIGIQILLARSLGKMVQESAIGLDIRLAEAITTAIDSVQDRFGEVMPSMEQPSMIQQAIYQMITQKMNPDIVVKEVSKGPDGKFIKDTSS